MLVGCAAAEPQTKTSAPPASLRPNVLLIVVDDLNTALGCYGDRLAKTPSIDRLAARGVVFERAYCQYPLCNPSRVSLLSGLRPETTGVYSLKITAREAVPEGILLPQFFRKHGYYSAGAGKIFHNERGSDAASWDRYEDGDGEDAEEKAALAARYGGGDGRPAWTILDSDGSKTRDGHNARVIAREIAARAKLGSPFFLAAGFHKPHLPWTAPRRHFDLHRVEDFSVLPESPDPHEVRIAAQTELSGFAEPDSPAEARRAYYACVSFMDEQLGLLLDELDRHDLWRSTLVVFLSDNGFHLGDHGGLWGKLSAFDASARVPLIMAGAGIPAGRRVVAPVELIDIYPTLAQLAGFSPPVEIAGKSLTASWAAPLENSMRAYSLVYHYDPATRRDIAGHSVWAEGWRYTRWDTEPAVREFFLLPATSGERVNVAAKESNTPLLLDAEKRLADLPKLKPGPAERPRALLKK